MPSNRPSPGNPHAGRQHAMLLGYLGVLLLALVVGYLPAAQQWESRWRDLGFRWLERWTPTQAHDGIVIVGIDDEDLKGFGVPAAMMHRELGAFL